METWEDLPNSHLGSKAGLIRERCWRWELGLEKHHEPVPLSILSYSRLYEFATPEADGVWRSSTQSYHRGGLWVCAEHRATPTTLFPLITATRTDNWMQTGHRGPLLFWAASLGEGCTWRRPGAHAARWSKQLQAAKLDQRRRFLMQLYPSGCVFFIL